MAFAVGDRVRLDADELIVTRTVVGRPEVRCCLETPLGTVVGGWEFPVDWLELVREAGTESAGGSR